MVFVKELKQHFYTLENQIRVNTWKGSYISDYPPIYPKRGEHAQGPTSWKLKESFFIFYRVCLHGIDLYGFGWEIIEFQHSKSIIKSKFEHRLHLVIQHDIYQKLHFLINFGFVHYLSYAILISFVASQGICYDIYCAGFFFCGFVALHVNWELMIERKLLKLLKISLHHNSKHIPLTCYKAHHGGI